jgi:hypothetical protein
MKCKNASYKDSTQIGNESTTYVKNRWFQNLQTSNCALEALIYHNPQGLISHSTRPFHGTNSKNLPP